MKILRTLLLALLGCFLAGFAIGTVIRLRMEAPHPGYFIGAAAPAGTFSGALARAPGHVRNAGSMVLDPRHHEEQVG